MAAEALAPYRLELAKSDRSACTVSKEKIAKDEVRFGSLLKVGGKGSYKWRKLACVTAKQAANIEEQVGGIDKIDGFAELTAEEQASVLEAFKVAEAAPVGAAKAMAKKAAAAPPEAADAEVSPPPAKKPRVSKKDATATAAALPAAAAAGAPSPDLEQAAHHAIDLAKGAQWKALFELLDVRPELVDVRPAVRDFAALHQAAYNGMHEVVSVLLEEYGADPLQLTKLGKTAGDIANEQGHAEVAEVLAKSIKKKPSLASGSAGLEVLTPEKVTKDKSRGGSSAVTPVAEASAAALAAAHKLIDLSKAGRWADAFCLLDGQRGLVNLRPDLREFGALHQAAYLGDAEAAEALVQRYGADPGQRSRSGLLPEEVARKEGHEKVAVLLAGFPKGSSAAGSASSGGAGAGAARAAAADEGQCDDDEDFKMVQMPNGSWKVVFVGGDAGTAGGSSSSSSSAAPPVLAVAAPSPEAVVPAAVAAVAAVSAVAAPAIAAAPTVAAVAAAPCLGPAADEHFLEAGWHIATAPGGDVLACRLKQGAAQAAVQQLLEREAGDRYCVWSRWAPTAAPGKHEALYFNSFEEALGVFKAKFHGKTNNQWRDRHAFKTYFSRWTLVAEAASPPTVALAAELAPVLVPAPGAAATVEEAHAMIDLAKAGKWADVFKALDKKGALVNCRPEVREYAVLHQAAYYGKADAAFTLLDKYGADAGQLTKSGQTAAVVAKECGHAALSARLAARQGIVEAR